MNGKKLFIWKYDDDDDDSMVGFHSWKNTIFSILKRFFFLILKIIDSLIQMCELSFCPRERMREKSVTVLH